MIHGYDVRPVYLQYGAFGQVAAHELTVFTYVVASCTAVMIWEIVLDLYVFFSASLQCPQSDIHILVLSQTDVLEALCEEPACTHVRCILPLEVMGLFYCFPPVTL